MSNHLTLISLIPYTIFIIIATGVTGCSSRDSKNNGTAPTLDSITFTPSESAAGIQLTVNGSFTFTDPDGDLGGGEVSYTYEGSTYSIPIDISFVEITSATVNFQAIVDVSNDTGDKNLEFTLIDSSGNQSNTISKTFTQLWTRQWGTENEDVGNRITVDNSNNIYVTGYTNGGIDGNSNFGGSDIFLTKFLPSNNKEWTIILGSSNDDVGRDITVDSDGNIYIVGSTQGNLDGISNNGQWDIFLAKYNPSGIKQWTRLLGTTLDDHAYGVTTDISGNIYITGGSQGNLDGKPNLQYGVMDIFLTKYTATGTRQWTTLLGSPNEDVAHDITSDSTGNIYITGYTQSSSFNSDSFTRQIFVVKFDGSINSTWTQFHDSDLGFSETESAFGITTDSDNNIYVAGSFAIGGSIMFLLKYNDSGVQQWVRTLNSDIGVADDAFDVSTDSNNNVYITGRSYGSYGDTPNDSEQNSLIFIKYNSGGDTIWLTQEGQAIGYGLVTDSNDNIYITGETSSNLDSSPNGGDPYQTGADVFVRKYDVNGVKH